MPAPPPKPICRPFRPDTARWRGETAAKESPLPCGKEGHRIVTLVTCDIVTLSTFHIAKFLAIEIYNIIIYYIYNNIIKIHSSIFPHYGNTLMSQCHMSQSIILICSACIGQKSGRFVRFVHKRGLCPYNDAR